MALSRACVAMAMAVSTQGFSVETDAVVAGVAADAPLAASKFIAGVPVLNYDQAYTGLTRSTSTLSAAEAAREESWIVVLKPGTSRAEVRSMCLRARACTVEGEHPRLPFIAMRGTEEELADVVEPVRDAARYIDLDKTVELDPLEYSSAVAQEVDAQAEEPFMWGLHRIGTHKTTFTGAGVHVFVADTGIRTDHVEFGGRAFPYLDLFNDTATPTRLCNESSDATCSGDVHSHGTHCAGTVAGQTYGVAPQARVYAAKVLSDQGSGSDSGIVLALSLIASSTLRPAVVSMSLGGPKGSASQTWVDAIDVLVAEGVPVVVSAGNDYRDACTKSPAFVPNAITVGSTAYGDVRSGFSNFGTCLDIWAPGSDILSSIPTTVNSSANFSGTSMACPHVAGAAALFLEKDPSVTPEQLRLELRQAASENYIADLSPRDENLLLYVGTPFEEPQPPRDDPWPSDEYFTSCSDKGQSGPLGDYPVCRCTRRADRFENGTTCYNGYTDTPGCPIGPGMTELNKDPQYNMTDWTLYYFLWNCTTCMCHEGSPVVDVPEFPPNNPTATTMILGIFGTFAAVLCCATAFTMNQKNAEIASPKLEETEVP